MLSFILRREMIKMTLKQFLSFGLGVVLLIGPGNQVSQACPKLMSCCRHGSLCERMGTKVLIVRKFGEYSRKSCCEFKSNPAEIPLFNTQNHRRDTTSSFADLTGSEAQPFFYFNRNVPNQNSPPGKADLLSSAYLGRSPPAV
jgi:hypothetical protein